MRIITNIIIFKKANCGIFSFSFSTCPCCVWSISNVIEMTFSITKMKMLNKINNHQNDSLHRIDNYSNKNSYQDYTAHYDEQDCPPGYGWFGFCICRWRWKSNLSLRRGDIVIIGIPCQSSLPNHPTRHNTIVPYTDYN